MRVSFDSNAWEKIFDPADAECEPIRVALRNGAIQGRICEAGFRIEAIRKKDRPEYFAQPHMEAPISLVMRNGAPRVQMSIGPNDSKHPGLPSVQLAKLQQAFSGGVLLMRGQNWMGLPTPKATQDPRLFVPETTEAQHEREQRQIDVSASIDARGVGYAAFEAVDGWNVSNIAACDEKRFGKACAEWADGELAAAHIAYQNDILCTNDSARSAGPSIFDRANRAWLAAQYGVVFKTIDELSSEIPRR